MKSNQAENADYFTLVTCVYSINLEQRRKKICLTLDSITLKILGAQKGDRKKRKLAKLSEKKYCLFYVNVVISRKLTQFFVVAVTCIIKF